LAPTPDRANDIPNSTVVNYLDAQDSLRRWQAFISEDRRNNPAQENRLFFQLNFANIVASISGDDRSDSLQNWFDAPGTINTLRHYWVHIGLFDQSTRIMASELLRALQRYFPDAVVVDREGNNGLYAFRIGPFQSAAEAAMVAQGIGDSSR
jgi:hypothetical protein